MMEELIIRPYARLLTMLGEQLIKNSQIALIELIKNSYDADASFVKVSFINFNDDFTSRSDSYIVIEDDGNGMDESILKNSWLNPGTPEKLIQKRKKQTTDKGRILQGEKGIGRFAVLKLGKDIEIISRRQLKDDKTGHFIDASICKECVMRYDFSKYDNDFLTENGQAKSLYLDDLNIIFESREPEEIFKKEISLGVSRINRKPYGTKIVIRDLNTKWNKKIIDRICDDAGKLQPLFGDTFTSDFQISFFRDSTLYVSPEDTQEALTDLLEEKSVFCVTGNYKVNGNNISLLLDNHTKELQFNFNFSSPEIIGLSYFKKNFKNVNRNMECGDFSFCFYVFDLDNRIQGYTKYVLNDAEKAIIKNHRIYLYRDGIRVMPYGDPDDDWLRTDTLRGIESASALFSNDQVVGFIYITQKENPNLKDKTNREGLIEEGYAYADLINVVQLVLRYVRAYPYKKYLLDKKRKQEHDFLQEGRSLGLINQVRKENKDNKEIESFLNKFEQTYKKEYDVLTKRIERTENLAAIGLSVQTASHDTLILLNRTAESFDQFMKQLNKSKGGTLDYFEIRNTLQPIKEALDIIKCQMTDIQKLFPSTKTRKRTVDVETVIRKIYHLYEKALLENDIDCNIISDKKGLNIIATDAVLMQVFINLFDNSLYWLKTVQGERKIIIEINGLTKTIIFSDSGPGIKKEYVPYVFEAFFSGKGEDGKGLGLYIAQQLLDRYGYSIEINKRKKTALLEGATFIINLSEETEDE